MTMTTAASAVSNRQLALHLLVVLLASPATAFYAESPAVAAASTWRPRHQQQYSIATRPSSKVLTILSQQHLHRGGNTKMMMMMMMTTMSNGGDFESLGLSEDLIAVTQSMNWDSPTPVQRLAIPAILAMAHHNHNDSSSNCDDDDGSIANSLWCEAPTGSGKTGGFALPLLQLLLLQQQQRNQEQTTKLGRHNRQRRRLGRISTLILCPTRELAAQTGDVLHQLASHLPTSSNNSSNNDDDKHNNLLSIDVVHGGVPTDMQRAIFSERYESGVDVDILVATPGRLLDILRPRQQNAEMMLSSLERRIINALDGKSMNSNSGVRESGRGTKKSRTGGSNRDRNNVTTGRGRGGGGGARITAASLSLNEIREMDLINGALDDDDGDNDRDDGTSTTAIREMLRGLQYLVLDEADKLLGKAFQDEMNELLSLLPIRTSSTTSGSDKFIINNNSINNSRQQLKTMLFSATFPEQIEERVERVLSRLSGGRGLGRPLRVSTSSASGGVLLSRGSLSSSSSSSDLSTDEESDGIDNHHLVHPSSDIDDDDSEHPILGTTRKHNITPIEMTVPNSGPNIRHRVIRLNEGDRTQALRFLLEQGHGDGDEWERVLVFVATRYAAEHVSRKLRRLGISASELHGKLDQDSREQRLNLFRSGKTRVLLATDLAARGIDIRGIDVVVNYDLPKSVADYTHRTGRTGRAGNSGIAISFVTGKSESHFDFLEKGISFDNGRGWRKVEREVLPKFAPDEEVWKMESAVSTASVPGAMHSEKGLEHDRTFGGIKGRRKSKKDKLREAAAAAASADVS